MTAAMSSRVAESVTALTRNCATQVTFNGYPLESNMIATICSGLKANKTVKSIDFSGIKLQNDHFLQIVQALEANTSLTEVNFDSCNLNPKQCEALLRLLDANDSLISISLNYNPLDNLIVQKVEDKCRLNTQSKDVKRALPRLLSNDSTFCEFIGTDFESTTSHSSLKVLTEAILKNTTLTAVRLRACKLDDYSTVHLTRMLNNTQNIKILDLSDNSIGLRGCKELADALKNTNKLTYLNLSNNKVGGACEEFTQALRHNDSVKYIEVTTGIPTKMLDDLKFVLELNRGRSLVKELYFGCIENNPAIEEVDLAFEASQIEGCVTDSAKLLTRPLQRNTHVKRVNFAGCLVGDEGCSHIASLIRQNKFIEYLNLMNNKISCVGCKEIAAALAVNQSIKEINIAKNNIGDDGIKEIIAALDSNCSVITVAIQNNLAISENTVETLKTKLLLNVQPISLKQLMPNLLSNNPSLTSIDFSKVDSSGRYHNEDSADLLSRALITNTTVTRLDISNNTLGPKGAIKIGEALAANGVLKYVNVSSNTIQNSGLLGIIKNLKFNNSLNTLVSDNNNLEDGVITPIVELLKTNHTLTAISINLNKISKGSMEELNEQLHLNTQPSSLKKLQVRLKEKDPFLANLDFSKFDGHRYYTDESIAILAKNLIGNSSIINLNLSNNRFTSKGAKFIGELLAKNDTITEVELSNCPIGDEGVAYIANAMRTNKTITRLVLADCGCTAMGIKGFADVIQTHNHTLMDVSFGETKPSDNDALALLDRALNLNKQPAEFKKCCALLHNGSIEELDFSNLPPNMKLTNVSAQILSNELKTNRSCKKLNLSNNLITAKGAAAIAEMLRVNENIFELNLSNNKLGDIGGRDILQALKESNDCLRYLTIENTGITSGLRSELDDAIVLNTIPRNLKKTIPYLKKNDPSLTTLQFNAQGFDNFSIHMLCELLLTNTNVAEIDLANNEFGKQGAYDLASVLRANQYIRSLNISGNRIDREGGVAFVQSLKGNVTLQYFAAENCGIPEDILEEIMAVIKINGIELYPDMRSPGSAGSLKLSSLQSDFNDIHYYHDLEDQILNEALATRSITELTDTHQGYLRMVNRPATPKKMYSPRVSKRLIFQ